MYLELDGEGPRHAQLTRALKTAVLEGRLAANQRLPAQRELAQELGMSRNTVLTAYEQLQAEGFIRSRVGSGSYVEPLDIEPVPRRPARTSVTPPSRYALRARQALDRSIGRRHYGLRYNLQYGEPLVDPVLTSTWRRALSRAAAYMETDYPPTQGLASLREAICDYLVRRRGVNVVPDDVLIVSGTQQAVALASRVLLDEGDSVVLEEPHYFAAQQALESHGARIESVRTDAEGLVCDELPVPAPKFAYVTPSHQFPGGAVMSLTRRLALLRYATRHDCWILEDDYDSEFRYDVHPLAALRALDSDDRVFYVGTFSKVLFPSLRLAYMVLPKSLRRDFIAAKWCTDMGCPAIEQAALAGFISDGSFERHLRRTVKALQARRTAILAGLKRHASRHIDPADSHAGMHVVAWLRDYTWHKLETLIEHARHQGLGLYSIAPHYACRPGKPALLLGYAGLPPADLEAAMALLGRCLREVA